MKAAEIAFVATWVALAGVGLLVLRGKDAARKRRDLRRLSIAVTILFPAFVWLVSRSIEMTAFAAGGALLIFLLRERTTRVCPGCAHVVETFPVRPRHCSRCGAALER